MQFSRVLEFDCLGMVVESEEGYEKLVSSILDSQVKVHYSSAENDMLHRITCCIMARLQVIRGGAGTITADDMKRLGVVFEHLFDESSPSTFPIEASKYSKITTSLKVATNGLVFQFLMFIVQGRLFSMSLVGGPRAR